jgi:hypothetical protein
VPEPVRLACFVTPHGFGHAARTCAVLAALGGRLPLAAELFTTVPEWFFTESLPVPFAYHAVACDVGLAQTDAMSEDLPATVAALDALLPFDERLVGELAGTVRASGCAAILCDVAALGIAVAARARLPVALLESFTWDWIYAAYLDREPRLAPHRAELAAWYARADLRLQAAPACAPAASAVQVGVVARRPRRPTEEVRAALGLLPGERAVLLTMGGIPWDWGGFRPRLPPDTVLVIPGGTAEPRVPPERTSWAVLLPFHSGFYHPDLVSASDAVVGKLGYSTFAEAWTAGVPYGFLARPTFPESAVLGAAVIAGAAGQEVPASVLETEDWGWLGGLLALARRPRGRPGGDDAAAQALAAWIQRP